MFEDRPHYPQDSFATHIFRNPYPNALENPYIRTMHAHHHPLALKSRVWATP